MATNFFDTAYYLASKLAQLQKAEPTNALWQGSNALVNLQNAIAAAGYTPESHFLAFGSAELTSPNKFFNPEEYLAAKAIQANADKVDGKTDWTSATIALAIHNAGMSVYEHFQQFGWKEGVNPSNSFDVAKYMDAKLLQMQATDPTYTKEQLIAAFDAAGIDPLAHSQLYGAAEGLKVESASNPVLVLDNGNTFTLTVGQDILTGTANNDTFKANVVQNAQGVQVNTLGSGDELQGGAGIDTLNAKITTGAYVNGAGNESMPIQPETVSIENVNLQAVLSNAIPGAPAVFVNAKDMVGVQKLSSNYSDASLVVMNMTTKGLQQLSDMTINMSYTGNSDSHWDESDFSVYFDQDYLTPKVVYGTPVIEFLAMNEDNYDASNGANPLEGVFFRQLQFTLNGTKFDLVPYLGEDANGQGNEIKTYADFLAAVQKALVALKAANPSNAALQSVQAEFGNKFTTDVNPTTLELREGTAVRLTVDGATDGKANTMAVASTDLEVARAANATVPNNNRYELADDTPPTNAAKLGINVELEKVGLAGDGGALVIGSMNKGDDLNVWNAVNTTVKGTTSGIEEFYVTVKGSDEKSSSLSELRSTNNNLRVVTVATDAAQTGTYANLTIGNAQSDFAAGNQGALKDVKTFDASAFKGNLTLHAALTDEVVAKYLDLKDKSPAAAAADNAAFVYTGGTGNDAIDLQVSASNLAKMGTATREDFSVNIAGGAGDDKITLSVVDNKTNDLADGATGNWYANQVQQNNLRINAGEGNDTIWTPGSGNVTIDAGAGNDTVYSDNTGAQAATVATVAGNHNATWVMNADAAGLELGDLLSGDNTEYTLYKTSVSVNFLGFEATVQIPDVAANKATVTELEINQAIKAAINSDAVLSKLLVAEDGPGNTLVVTSLVDGVRAVGNLSVTLEAGTLTAGDLAQLTAWGVNPADITADVGVFNGAAYAVLAQSDAAADLVGANSVTLSDNTITGGAGDDVLVLSTSALSSDTLVYSGLGNGTDSIVNFLAGAVVAGANQDVITFKGYTGVTAIELNGALITGTAAAAGEGYISIVEDATAAGKYTVTQFIEAGATDTVVGVIGVLDFGATQAFDTTNLVLA